MDVLKLGWEREYGCTEKAGCFCTQPLYRIFSHFVFYCTSIIVDEMAIRPLQQLVTASNVVAFTLKTVPAT